MTDDTKISRPAEARSPNQKKENHFLPVFNLSFSSVSKTLSSFHIA